MRSKFIKVGLILLCSFRGICGIAISIPDTIKNLYDDGSMKSMGLLENGKEEGLWIKYYPGGLVNAREEYKKGLLWGNCIYYYPNGNKMREEHWVKGVQLGPTKIYYESGGIKGEGNMEEAGFQGPWVFFHENSKMKQRGKYDGGLPVGTWEFFDENEILIKSEEFGFENSAPNDSLSYVIYYYPNGQIMMEGKIRKGKESGSWILNKKNGKQKSKVDY